jgi:hypothetical protein
VWSDWVWPRLAGTAVVSLSYYAGSQANLMLEWNNLGTPRTRTVVSAWAGSNWGIFTLAVDMRPGASPHIGLCRSGNCNIKTRLIYVGIVPVGNWIKLWRITTIVVIVESSITATLVILFRLSEPIEHKMSKLKLWSDICYCVVVAWFLSGA